NGCARRCAAMSSRWGCQLQVRTSIGVSSFARSQQDASVALALADQALYEAKLAGRDQVKAFDGHGQHFPPSN
ncbi:diguanylate cyclase domain-containing protein, partial [Aquitalea pelogenes]|uniref:diguanylate cyclase domain-containing protein n=1 Tax=Aquitalea pelogenes TaxID=1293573 RepID=UPI00195DA47F